MRLQQLRGLVPVQRAPAQVPLALQVQELRAPVPAQLGLVLEEMVLVQPASESVAQPAWESVVQPALPVPRVLRFSECLVLPAAPFL